VLEPEMKIVKNYKRLSQVDEKAKKQGEKGTKFVVSPITGELISVDDMAEHMRISLIDPKWREQRDAMLAKIKDTTKATDDEIARNVSSLANTRPDIFGSTEEEISRIVAAEVERSKKAADFMEKNRRGPMEQPNSSGDHQGPQGPSTSSAPSSNITPQAQAGAAAPGVGRGRGGSGFPHSNAPMHSRRPPPMPMHGMPGAGAPPGYGFRPPPPGMQNNMRMPMPPMNHMRMPPPSGFRPPMPSGRAPPLPMGGGMGMPRPPMPPMPMPPTTAGAGGQTQTPPPPPPSSSSPEAKRPKLGDSSGGGVGQALQPEAQWLASHAGAAKIKVKLPNNAKSNEKLNGEVLEVEVETLSISVQALKQMLSPMLGLAANKQKLQVDTVGFLKDNLSLAHYNLSEESTVSLGVKERGGRKK
jgi:splicing factor 3A subunit 1